MSPITLCFSLLLPFALSHQDPEPIVRTNATEDGGVETYECTVDADGNEVRQGDYRRVHPDGETLAEEGQFRDGRKFGKWQTFYESGHRHSSGKFLDGVRNRAWRFYYDQRRNALRCKGEFDRGLRTGEWEFFGPDGEPDLVNSGDYLPFDGWIATDRVWGRGELIRDETRSRWVRHGEWSFDWPGGARMLEATFERAEPVGEWRFSHCDGTLDPRFLPEHAPPPLEETDEPLPTALDLAPLLTRLPAPSAETAARVETLLAEDPSSGVLTASPLAEHRRELLPALLRILADEPAPEAAVRGALALRRLFPSTSFAHLRLDSDQRPTLDSREIHRWFSFWWLTENDRALWGLEVGDAGSNQPGPAPLRPSLPPVTVEEIELDLEDSVALALEWLVAHQSEDGSWPCADFDAECGRSQSRDRTGICEGEGYPEHEVGVTALSALVLTRAGITAGQGVYGDSLARAAVWLAAQARPDGLIGEPLTREFVYDHTIALSALSGVAADVHSDALLQRLELGLERLLTARDPYAGWRYDFPSQGKSDVSVTGWAISALVAARDAGLAVDETALEGAQQFIQNLSDPTNGRIGYNFQGGSSSRIPGVNDSWSVDQAETMTAVGLLAQLTAGADDSTQPLLEKHADLILRSLPHAGSEPRVRDMYYWRAASEALRLARDLDKRWYRRWRAWSDPMREVAVSTQITEGHAAGSWDPVGPWGMIGGRVYSTAMMTLALLACEDD